MWNAINPIIYVKKKWKFPPIFLSFFFFFPPLSLLSDFLVWVLDFMFIFIYLHGLIIWRNPPKTLFSSLSCTNATTFRKSFIYLYKKLTSIAISRILMSFLSFTFLNNICFVRGFFLSKIEYCLIYLAFN